MRRTGLFVAAATALLAPTAYQGGPVAQAVGGTAAPEISSVTAEDPLDVLAVGDNNWRNLCCNTGFGAQSFASQMSGAGWATTLDTDGRQMSQVFEDMKTHEIIFLHGHGARGLMNTAEGRPWGEAYNETLLADIPETSSWDSESPAAVAEVADLLPSELDDALLVVYSACKTAATDPSWGNLVTATADKGADTVLGWYGSPLIPVVREGADYNTAGNYFWRRAGVYLKDGMTVGRALNKATQDTLDREGSTSGWDRYSIGGAAAEPAMTRVSPARSGRLQLADAGVDPTSDPTLVAARSETTTVAGEQVTDSVTDGGLSYRTETASGELLAISGQAASGGLVELTQQEAETAARQFAQGQVGEDGRVTDRESTPVTSTTDAVATRVEFEGVGADGLPTVMAVDIDRRSGLVTNYVRGIADESVVDPTVDSQLAADAARDAVPGTDFLGIHYNALNSMWVVRLGADATSQGPGRKYEVWVDGATGRISAMNVAVDGSPTGG